MTTIEKGKFKIEIEQEEYPMNPRSNDNISKMVCFHRRYNLGDNHNYKHENYDSWDEMEKDIIRKEKTACIKRLFLYDHSGITISTSSFNDRWDSGTVGFIFITKKDLRKNFLKKRVSKKLIERCNSIIEGEVSEYDSYLRGDVYTMSTYENNELIDCIGEIYGDNFWENGMSSYVSKEMITELKEELEKEFGKKI
jgi:hypothetical protein